MPFAKRLFTLIPFILLVACAIKQISFDLGSPGFFGFLFSVLVLLLARFSPLKPVARRSALHAYFTAFAVFGALYFSVRLRLWSGLYVNFDLARVMLYLLTAGLFASFVLSKLLRLSFDRGIATANALILSAFTCLYFLTSRIFTSDVELGFFAVTWMYFSIAATHALAGWALLGRPRRTWHWSFRLVQSVCVLQVCVLLFIAAFVDSNYPYADRAKGVFAQTSPHLKSIPKSNRQISSVENSQLPQLSELKVLNFNAWIVEGWIPSFITTPSKDVDARIALLPAAIREINPDVIIFEEVWTEPRRAQLKTLLSETGYPYSVDGSNSLMSYLGIGNGLLIVSKYRLDQDIKAMTYSGATRIDESTPFVRKGAIKTRLEIAPSRWIDVYATHLGASDTVLKDGHPSEFDPEQLRVQLEQINELRAFIETTKSSTSLLLGADLNTAPKVFEKGAYSDHHFAPVYSVLTCADPATAGCLNLMDSTRGFPLKSYNTRLNVYANSGYFSYEPPGQIDYVFSRGPELSPEKSELVFVDAPLSDHYGLLTTYRLSL
jgi:hypothetical protein